MKSSPSESKAVQSRSKGEILGRTRRKEWLSRSKLKQAFLIDSDAELFMYLIQCIIQCIQHNKEFIMFIFYLMIL